MSGPPLPTSAPQTSWFLLEQGQITVSAASSVPNASYLSYNSGLSQTGLIGGQDGEVVFLAGLTSQLDGGQGWFMWQASSVAVPDGTTIFNPNSSLSAPGRWHKT